MKKTLIILGLLSFIAFAGCSKENEVSGDVEQSYTYFSTETRLDIPTNMEILDNYAFNDRIYSLGVINDDADEAEKGKNYYVSIFDLEGKKISSKLILQTSSFVSREAFCVLPNENILFSYGLYGEDDEWIDNTFVYDKSWNIISTDETGIGGIIEDCLTYPLPNNNFLLLNNGVLYEINEKLEVVNKGKIPDRGVVVSACQNGLSVLYSENGKDYIGRLDESNLTVSDVKECSVSCDEYGIMSGDEYYLFYVNNLEKLYGYKDDELTEILDFFDCGLISGMGFYDFKSIDENHMQAIDFSPTDLDGSSVYIINLEKGLDNRTEIRVANFQSYSACYYKAALFNRENKDYRVTLVNYHDFVTDEQPLGDREQLLLDITTGKGPDVLAIDDPSLTELLMHKKALAPLDSFIENDSEIRLDDFFPNLIEAGSYDNKMYAFIPEFGIDSMVMSDANCENIDSWTLDAFMEYVKASENGCDTVYCATRADILDRLITANHDLLIKGSKVDFTNDTFTQILEIANMFPKTNVYPYYYMDDVIKFRNDEVTIDLASTNSSYTYAFYRYYLEDAPIRHIGIPTAQGGRNLLTYDMSISILASSKNKDGAWEFVRCFMSDDYLRSRSDSFVAKEKLFLEHLKYESIDWIILDDRIITRKFLTDEDYEYMYELASSAQKVPSYDPYVKLIVMEEAEPFFEGQKSIEEVEKVIESRVSTYLKETR